MFMAAQTPEEISDLFMRYMSEGNLDAVVDLYDENVAFAAQGGKIARGRDAVREELRGFAEARTPFTFDVKRVVQANDTALIHNLYTIESSPPMSGYAIEVARRQPDGTWRWLIGDPFTVGAMTSIVV
jgi:ketosteroid isomerase-like protein